MRDETLWLTSMSRCDISTRPEEKTALVVTLITFIFSLFHEFLSRRASSGHIKDKSIWQLSFKVLPKTAADFECVYSRCIFWVLILSRRS